MNVNLSNSDKIRILNGVDLFEVMVRVLKRSSKIDQKKQHFWVVGLDITHEILFIELLQFGGNSIQEITPRHVFNLALRKDAFQLVLVHNQPSGNIKPNDEVRQLTGKMVVLGEYHSIPIWDHMIISEKSYFSFLDSELLEIVAASVQVPTALKDSLWSKEEESKNLIIRLSKSVVRLYEIGMKAKTIASIIDLPESEIQMIIDEHERGEPN